MVFISVNKSNQYFSYQKPKNVKIFEMFKYIFQFLKLKNEMF